VDALLAAQRNSSLPLVPDRATGSRPTRPNMSRVEGKHHRFLLRAAEDFNVCAVRALDGVPYLPEPCCFPPYQAAVGDPHPPVLPSPDLDPEEWAAAAHAVAADYRARATRILNHASWHAASAGGRAFRKRLSKNRKGTTRALFSSGDPESLTEVNTPDGSTSRDPDTVISVVSDCFTALQTPDSEVNLSTAPWELDLDPCTTAKPSCPPARLGNRITRDLVATTIARSPKRGDPGPDGLLGETLRCVPSAVVDLIARLQTEYWDGGYLPTHLKESVTTLLHKKGDPREPGNYRPIALANTLAKTYTMVVQTVLSDFMEESGMLSARQEGFRLLATRPASFAWSLES